MSSKKGFNRKKQPPLGMKFPVGGGISWPDVCEFRKFLLRNTERIFLSADVQALFVSLCDMPPAARLTRSLKLLLSLLTAKPVRHVMKEGLLPLEQTALLELERVQAPATIKAIATGLLHINERQQLADSLRGLYSHERERHWG